MTRGRLNRIMLIPALIVAAGLLVLFVSSGLLSLGADLCTRTETVQAPSGRTLRLCETRYETQPSNDTWAIIRVVDTDLTAANDTEDHADHDHVCTIWGLPTLDTGPRPARVIVQIMAEAFPRGEPTPGISQAIEGYSIQNGTCIWELL